MRTVFFDDINSFEHLDLILGTKSIGKAEPKYLSVEIEGGDGELDYTDYFGDIHYKNRPLSFAFSILGDKNDFLRRYSEIQNLLNGRKMKITLSEDRDWYYVGRVTVNDWQSKKNIGEIVIDVNAEPYKLRHALTVVAVPKLNSVSWVTVNCKNCRMPTIATISADGGYTLKVGDNAAKEYSGDAEITLTEGDNVLMLRASSVGVNVKISYREGSL